MSKIFTQQNNFIINFKLLDDLDFDGSNKGLWEFVTSVS